MVLITGDKGYIGSKLGKLVPHVGIDLKDGFNLLTCPLPVGIDTIYHLAAQTSVESSWYDPVHDADNLRMLVRLVHAYPTAKIVYTNSAAALQPSSPYGFSKWACAEYLKRFHRDYVICTLPNIYGDGGHGVVDLFRGKHHVTIYGDGSHTRDYVYVGDIVDGLLKAKHWFPGEYQFGSGIATSVFELAKGKNITFADERQEIAESVLVNNTPNWHPKMNVHDYLSQN